MLSSDLIFTACSIIDQAYLNIDSILTSYPISVLPPVVKSDSAAANDDSITTH